MGNEDAAETVLPDVSNAGIAQSTWLIYRMIQSDPDFKRGRPKKYDGRPGVEWTGSVNRIIDALWPKLSDRYVVERERANEIKLALNRYLRNTRNVVCMHNGGTRTTSTWWISDNWSNMTVTRRDEPIVSDQVTRDDSPVPESSLSDVFDVPAPEPTLPTEQVSTAPPGASTEEEEMDDTPPEDEASEYACRVSGCTETFNGGQGRASHERKHGIRFNLDGTTTTFDPERFGRDVTVGEVNRLVIDVLQAHPDGLTHGDVVEQVLSVDPTVKRDEVKKSITRLMFKSWNGHQVVKVTANLENGVTSYSRRLHLNSARPTPANVPPRAKTTSVSGATTTLTGHQVDTERVDTPQSRDDLTLAARHAGNLRVLLTDLDKLSRLEEGLRQSSLKNRELVDRLRAVTAERDELQGKLNGLRALLGAGE